MRKLIVSLAVTLFCAFELVALGGESELEKKVKELEGAVKNLESLVKDLSFRVQQAEALSAIVKEMGFQFKKAESDLRELQGFGKRLTEEVVPKILTLESTVAGMAQSFQQKLDIQSARIFELETTVDGIDARLRSAEGKLFKLQELQEDLKRLQSRVEALESALKLPPELRKPTEIEMVLKELSERLKGLEGKIAQQAQKIVGVEAVTQANADAVGQLSEDVKKLRKDLASAQQQATTNMAVATVGVLAGLVAIALSLGLIKF